MMSARPLRGYPFHDCLLPMLHRLNVLVAHNNSCILSDYSSALRFVRPLLQGTVSLDWHYQVIIERTRRDCVRNMSWITTGWAFPPKNGGNLALLHTLMERTAPDHNTSEPYVVLVHRWRMEREFGSVAGASSHFISTKEFSDVLSQATGLRTLRYFGNESIDQTLQYFAHAQGVVGYHGAGMFNAVWTPHAMCCHELTTFVDRNSSSPWLTTWLIRVGYQLSHRRKPLAYALPEQTLPGWIPLAKVTTHFIPLDDMLEANGKELSDTPSGRDRDTFLRSGYSRRIGLSGSGCDEM